MHASFAKIIAMYGDHTMKFMIKVCIAALKQ